MAKTIKLEPNGENTARWFASALAGHAFEKGAVAPVLSFVEQVAYLALTDPEALGRMKAWLEAQEKGG